MQSADVLLGQHTLSVGNGKKTLQGPCKYGPEHEQV